MKLRVILVEDEINSREILRNYLTTYCPDVTLAGEAASMEEGLELIEATSPDLVFLDVEMPFGNAFDLLDRLPGRSFETIFVTAYKQYAIDALNLHTAYYLMKPIAIDELIKAVAYVKALREKERAMESQLLHSKAGRVEGKITLPEQEGFKVLEVAAILYCQAEDNYTRIFLEDRKLLVSKTLKYVEDALAEFPFARIHKSFLVNVNEVVRYKKGKGGSVILSNGKELSVSASRKQHFLSYFE